LRQIVQTTDGPETFLAGGLYGLGKSLGKVAATEALEAGAAGAAKAGTEGGLNLFKFGKPTTTTAER